MPGDGVWLARVEQQATTGLDALADALRQPDDDNPLGQPVACWQPGQNGPIIISVTDSGGRQTYPHVPRAACGAPQ